MADLITDDWPPAPFATARLILRPTQASDRDGYLDLLSSGTVRVYLGGPVAKRADLERAAPPVPGARPGVFAIEQEGTFIGIVQLDRRDPVQPGHIRADGHELEVSYQLLPHYWGFGYTQEAVSAVLTWAALTLPDDDVIVCTQVANARSLRLATHLGFIESARFHQFGAVQWLGYRRLPELT